MPWKENTLMSLRLEFVQMAEQEGVDFTQLCQHFGINRKTGYKWLRRYQEGGAESLEDRSRRPHLSPGRTSAETERMVLEVRQAHPAWGGRKIRSWLENQGHHRLPGASTITAILRRQEWIDPEEAQKHRPFQRFEMEKPNQLWQMDFKGYFALSKGSYCHPLTVLDDHSRFLAGLRACPDETRPTVQSHLTTIFRRYGLPDSLLMDNGSPWGGYEGSYFTVLTVWLLRLGIEVVHGRPYHPQTLGKDERLHRTLKAELLSRYVMDTLSSCQAHFDRWRDLYNCQRPHEALNQQPPITRYRPSERPFPEPLPPIVYEPGDIIRQVDAGGRIYFHNRKFRIGKAFRRNPVALRPGEIDGVFQVFFCTHKVAEISLQDDNTQSVTHVSEHL